MPDEQTCTTMIERRLAGESVEKIGAATGFHHSTVSRTLNKPEIAAKIEALQERVANELFEQAVDNIKHAVEAYKQPQVILDPQLREHGFKLSQRIAESMGILPTQHQSILVQNVFNQTNTISSPLVDQILAAHASGQVIDITPEDGD